MGAAAMLPGSDVTCVDEVLLGCAAVRNTMRGRRNARGWRRGRTAVGSPVRMWVGAASRLP
ncbi:hypothetical protein VM98_33470, partial [Streptomyces rubellomurinus subsp. indigoferus]